VGLQVRSRRCLSSMAIAARERTITALLLRRPRENVDRLRAHAATLERLELDSEPSGRVGVLPLVGLAILEACGSGARARAMPGEWPPRSNPATAR
jgi:hypothetical protein